MSEFERWQTRFSVPEYVFGTAPNAFLRAHAHLLPAKGTALAVADGEGRNGVWLAEQGLEVLSLDFSPAAQAKARALAKQRGVSLRIERADVTTWSWPDAAFDVVAAIFVQFVGPDERGHMFAGIRKALKPGGLLLLQGYRPKQLDYQTGGPKQIENMYTRELLEREFAGFAALDITEHDSVIEEGTSHVGMAALIDLVGRR
jgi:cyclopropane fatty-acyl-phospholipid synthase-like methyltransferase